MGNQALLYSLAFFLTFSFPIINALLYAPTKEKEDTERHVAALLILRSIFYPLQGFFNFIFYIRPGVNHIREIDPNKSLIAAMKQAILRAESGSSNPRQVPSPTGTTRLRRSSISFLNNTR